MAKKNWKRDPLGEPEWVVEDQDGKRQAFYNWGKGGGLLMAGGAGGGKSQSNKVITGLVGTIAAAFVALVIVVGMSAYTALKDGVPAAEVIQRSKEQFEEGAKENAIEGVIDAVNPLSQTSPATSPATAATVASTNNDVQTSEEPEQTDDELTPIEKADDLIVQGQPTEILDRELARNEPKPGLPSVRTPTVPSIPTPELPEIPEPAPQSQASGFPFETGPTNTALLSAQMQQRISAMISEEIQLETFFSDMDNPTPAASPSRIE